MSDQPDQPDQPRRRRRQAPPPSAPGQGSVARGAILVAVAVVIGVLLLRDDDGDATQVAVGSDTAAEVDSATVQPEGDEDPEVTTTTTTQVARDPAEVKVLVANGSGVDGAAGGTTDALEALGYVTGTPANADRVQATIVYYTTGFEVEAEALAAAIGATPESVTPMPAVAPVDDLQLANVLVHLGPDLVSAD